MKVYRNSKDPRKIGCKFDNLRYSQVGISATGDIEKEVIVEFTKRDRATEGDFNADEHYMKDYDADMARIFGDMLGVCNNDKSARFHLEHQPNGKAFIKVAVTKAQDGCDFDALIERLLSLLSACVN